MNMITWLVKNTFVIVGNKIYQQVIGIPMGTDCAPFLANLFLFSYEFRFMNNQLKARNYEKLRKFTRCCRYIDDLLVINNMDKYKNLIYPAELTLSSDYLDLRLEIVNKTSLIKFTISAIILTSRL